MAFGAEDTLKVNIIGDASKLKGALSEADIGIAKFANKVGSIGTIMTLVGGAITAVSVKLIKMASDAEETATKFAVVFKDVSDEAMKVAKNLTDNFGLSTKAAKQLLSDTGDLLTGFGFTGQAALDLSTKVNELAVDLASFTNYSGGAEGASRALTKALLGERESVKSLGISILETDVQAKVFLLTQQGMRFETDRQAKAYATLLIAQEQSKNAIGDFARTSEGFANQMRILKAKVSDVAIALGEKLLPIATKLVGKVIVIVEKMNKWIEAHPKLVEWIVRTGAILGGIALVGGPILMAAAAFMKAKTVIDSITFALKLLNIRIGATGAVTTGTLIPSLVKIKLGLGTLGTIATGPIGILILAVGGLYAAWKTNLFGMRDITIEALDSIKGNFAKLTEYLGGGGGGAGAFFEEGITPPGLGEGEGLNEEAKKAADEFAKAISEINDRMYELSHTTMEYAIKKLDEQRQAYIDLGIAIGIADDWHSAEIKKLNDVSEAYDAFLDAMKTVEDRMFELTHTQREVEIKQLDEKKAKLIEIAKQAGLSADEEIAKIKEILAWYQKEIDLLNKKEGIIAGRRYNIYQDGKIIASVGSAQAQHMLEEGYNVQEIPSTTPTQQPGEILPSYQVGIRSVPRTQLALVHQGEEINPPGQRSYDQSKREINININNPIVRNDSDIPKIKQQVFIAMEEFVRQYGRQGFEMAH